MISILALAPTPAGALPLGQTHNKHPSLPRTPSRSCFTFLLTMTCCSEDGAMAGVATFWCCGLLAQCGLIIWLLVDAIKSLFKNDSGIECPGKVTDWTYWIFIWCILYVLDMFQNRKKDDERFDQFMVSQIALTFGKMICGLIFGLVTQYQFWNLCGGPLNGTVEKYMYLQYGILAWSFCLLLMMIVMVNKSTDGS